MRLTNSLFLIGSGDMGLSMTHPQDCNVYLLNLGDAVVLIDSGLGIEPQAIDAQLRESGVDASKITHLLLTHGHADHAGGAAWFRERYGLTVVAPHAEADFIRNANETAIGLDIARNAGFYPADYRFKPCPVDQQVQPGDVLRIGETEINIYEAAGHSIGGVCYNLNMDGQKLLFTGDLLAYGGRISLQNIPGADIHAYSRSVLALENLEVDILLPGHLQMLLSRGKRVIDEACGQFRALGVPKNII